MARKTQAPRKRDALAAYHRKRRFDKTPEPEGHVSTRNKRGLTFCVQKHDATHLHYDFRLELDGVMLSWAVPKGPSLDPAVKRLAMEVEAHPIDYRDFEGTIPRGEYGGGTVLLWDRGTWRPLGDPAADYRRGRLKFELHGEKLHGQWSLVRMPAKGEKKPAWLLMKSADSHARSGRTDVTLRMPKSVASGRTIEQIAKAGEPAATDGAHTNGRRRKKAARPGRPRLALPAENWPPEGAVRRPMPDRLNPQLATLIDGAPGGKEWVHELKLDGYRLLAFKSGANVRLVTRNGKDWTRKLDRIVAGIKGLGVGGAILDGELVALDAEGRSVFQALQHGLKKSPDELVYICFDLPWCAGYDLSPSPLLARKRILQQLLAGAGDAQDAVRFSDHLLNAGPSVYEIACRHGAEGIISKRADSPYTPGRSRSWLKIKCHRRQEFVIGGYTAPTGSRVGFGALLMGYYEPDGSLKFAGRVGTGFDDALLADLTKQLAQLKTRATPFANPPTGAAARNVTWVRPELVAEARFSEWTSDGSMRHPVFEGIRMDKPANEVRLEKPADRAGSRSNGAVAGKPPAVEGNGHAKARDSGPRKRLRSPKRPAPRKAARARDDEPAYRSVTITHPDRVVFAEAGLTKGDVAAYYDAVADRMLPHVVDRPLMLVRCPQGTGGECFYQKHWEHPPPQLHAVQIKESSRRRAYPIIQDDRALLTLVQYNCIEFHTWGCTKADVESADRVIFDLDPGRGISWPDVVAAARGVRDLLQRVGLRSFVKTSGGAGLHVVAPLSPPLPWDRVRGFAERVSRSMAAAEPEKYVATMTKSRRVNRIYVDYLRNSRGATCVAAFSMRARPGATVSLPLRWEELREVRPGGEWTTSRVLARLRSRRADPWHGYSRLKQSLPAAE